MNLGRFLSEAVFRNRAVVGSKDLDEWSSSLSGALKEFYASKDLDEAVERLDGLAQAHHEEALDKYMWAVVEESKSERRVLASLQPAGFAAAASASLATIFGCFRTLLFQIVSVNAVSH